MKIFKKEKKRNGQRQIYLLGIKVFSYKRKKYSPSLCPRCIELQKQLDYMKEHCDIFHLKPATGLLRKQQLDLIQFAADFFKEIEEIHISPFLTCGNLLGYVRHNGFIPWDDDLDFGLIHQDYEKLIEYCSKKFHVFTYAGKMTEYGFKNEFKTKEYLCKTYPNQYVLTIWPGQLQLFKGTSLDDYKYLDFWPFDFFKDSYSFSEHTEYLHSVREKMLKINYGDKIVDFLKTEREQNPNIVDDSNHIYFGIDSNLSYLRTNENWIPKEVIFPLREVMYENQKVLIPNQPDEYVKYEFKDYMEFPEKFGVSAHNEALEGFKKGKLKGKE